MRAALVQGPCIGTSPSAITASLHCDGLGWWAQPAGRDEDGSVRTVLNGDVVFREKRREDLIRAELNARCFRLTWADLDRPKETGQRLADMLGVRPLWKRIS